MSNGSLTVGCLTDQVVAYFNEHTDLTIPESIRAVLGTKSSGPQITFDALPAARYGESRCLEPRAAATPGEGRCLSALEADYVESGGRVHYPAKTVERVRELLATGDKYTHVRAENDRRLIQAATNRRNLIAA